MGVQATAIHGSNGSLVTLFKGFLNCSELFLDAQEPIFREVLKSYASMHVNNLSTCLMLDVWVFLPNGTFLETMPPMDVPIQPLKALEELVQKDVALNPQKMVKSEITQMTSGKSEPLDAGYWQIEWRPINDYCYYSDLTDIPVLIVTNPCAYSGVIGWSVILSTSYESTLRITFAYGTRIIAYAPYVTLTIYNGGWSISEKCSFSRNYYTLPECSNWVYIKARFAHVHERKWRVFYFAGYPLMKEPTDEERIREYIYSIQLDGNTIVGGLKNGQPPQNFMDWFYNGTMEECLSILGTPLSDGSLDVGESIAFPQIFNHYDQYNEDFEIGIPIGAIMATAAGLPVAYLGLVSGLTVSIGWGRSYTIDANGALDNWGEELGYGYDILEVIYVRVSKYRYTCPSGYTYKVPAGIYFKCY